MKRTRILHLQYNRGHPGGPEVFIALMARTLEARCVAAYYNIARDRFCEDIEEILVAGQEQQLRTAGLLTLSAVVRTWRPDIIHMHWPPAMVYGQMARAATLSRAKTVAHFHVQTGSAGSDDSGRGQPPAHSPLGCPSDVNSLRHPRALLRSRLESHCIKRCSAIVSCSRETGNIAASYWRIDPKRVEVLYNPVDVMQWDQSAPDVSFRASVGAGQKDLLVVFVGRLSMMVKGLDVLCRAVGLIDRGMRVKLAIIGPGDPEVLHEHIMDPARVAFVGPLGHDHLPSVLKACDIYVQPSRWEGFPLVVLEAMAAGLPVIATRVGGISEAVEDGVTGILVEPEAPKALAVAMQWMVEHPTQRKQMGLQGSERARLFDVQAIAGQLEGIYWRLLTT